MLQDVRGHRFGRRGRVCEPDFGAGVLFVCLSSVVIAEPALGKAHARCHLPQLLATLTAIAARDVFAVVLGGTATIGATFEAIEMVVCGVLSVGRVAEPSVPYGA